MFDTKSSTIKATVEESSSVQPEPPVVPLPSSVPAVCEIATRTGFPSSSGSNSLNTASSVSSPPSRTVLLAEKVDTSYSKTPSVPCTDSSAVGVTIFAKDAVKPSLKISYAMLPEITSTVKTLAPASSS